MWGPEQLKEFAPKVDQRSAVGVGAGSETGWDVLGLDPKPNLRLPVDEKRWIFNRLQEVGSATTGFWQRGV